MSVIYYTDSCSDLPHSYFQERNLKNIPLTYRISDEEYADDITGLSPKVFYDRLRRGETSTTSQIPQGTYMDTFRKALQNGDDVVYIAFGSALSGSCQSAQMAAEALEKEYPGRRVYVVDSYCASLGEGLLVHYALNLRDQGKSAQEVVDWLEANRGSIIHWFTADDLQHLRRGGRVSATAAFLGTMLNIKVILHVDDAGKLIPMEKVKGRKRALRALVDHMRESVIDPASQTVFISHADCLEEAQSVADMVRAEMGVTEFLINNIGTVIGSHTGAGTIALFFVGRHR